MLAPNNAHVVTSLDTELLLTSTAEANGKGLKEVMEWHSFDEVVNHESVEESSHDQEEFILERVYVWVPVQGVEQLLFICDFVAVVLHLYTSETIV